MQLETIIKSNLKRQDIESNIYIQLYLSLLYKRKKLHKNRSIPKIVNR